MLREDNEASVFIDRNGSICELRPNFAHGIIRRSPRFRAGFPA
jgi:hypothetical protein